MINVLENIRSSLSLTQGIGRGGDPARVREALRLSQAELSDAIEVLKAGRLHPEAVAELRVALLLEQIAVELTGPALANANAQQVQRDLARWTVQVEEALKSSTTRSAQTEVLSSLRAAASGRPGAGAAHCRHPPLGHGAWLTSR